MSGVYIEVWYLWVVKGKFCKMFFHRAHEQLLLFYRIIKLMWWRHQVMVCQVDTVMV